MPRISSNAVTFAASLFLAVASPANAVPFSGTMSGSFANPVFAGTIVNPVAGTSVFQDNNGTATFSGLGTNSIVWGDTTPWTLSFAGASFSSVPANTPFLLGTLTFFNGTNFDVTSVIFGADLELSDGPDIIPFTLGLSMVYTNNTGTAAQNADVFSFTGLPLSYHVLEGATGTADLYALLDANGNLTLTDLIPTNDGGFVPEPASLALLSLGLAGLGFSRRKSAQA